MSRLIIQPHGRLNDWVADEKGYFRDLGLDYEINLSTKERNSQTAAALNGAAPISGYRLRRLRELQGRTWPQGRRRRRHQLRLSLDCESSSQGQRRSHVG